MDYTPNSVQAEAIANANAELNNVGLPNVHWMAVALKQLLNAPTENNKAAAQAFLDRIEPHLATNI